MQLKLFRKKNIFPNNSVCTCLLFKFLCNYETCILFYFFCYEYCQNWDLQKKKKEEEDIFLRDS